LLALREPVDAGFAAAGHGPEGRRSR
jgi:hypothetical protein